MNYTPTCPICGQPIQQGGIFLHEAPYLLLCNNCGPQFWTCFSCAFNEKCEFQANPNNLPPVVMKTIQRGNMVVQQQVINPDLINETCKAGCRCWNVETETCLKQVLNSCDQHELATIYQQQEAQPQ